jgi:hypothetical protein
MRQSTRGGVYPLPVSLSDLLVRLMPLAIGLSYTHQLVGLMHYSAAFQLPYLVVRYTVRQSYRLS